MRFNRLFFWLFYRFGTPPWEGHPLPQRLLELVEGPSALPPGKALDAGCGTGDTSIYLAQRGWDVTAFDFVHVALNRARAKAAAAGVSIRAMQADVTRVTASEIGTGFRLIVDNGLLHGLSDEARDAYVRLVRTVAAPQATLIITAFAEKPTPRTARDRRAGNRAPFRHRMEPPRALDRSSHLPPTRRSDLRLRAAAPVVERGRRHILPRERAPPCFDAPNVCVAEYLSGRVPD